MEVMNRVETCMWMINHYQTLANGVFDIYPDIVDAYTMYDHYMRYVDEYRGYLDRMN